MKNYNNKATIWAERFGICDYKVYNNKMHYTVTYPIEGSYKHIIDLKTDEETIIEMKNRIEKGKFNR